MVHDRLAERALLRESAERFVARSYGIEERNVLAAGTPGFSTAHWATFAELGWLDLLKGEIITVSNFDLALTGGALAFVLVVLGLFNKELLFVSFDRAMAATLGKNVVFWDALLYLLIGFTVSIAVLSVGPLIAFGFLLVPALTAHIFARDMKWFVVLASVIGGVAAFLGFWFAVGRLRGLDDDV